MEPWTRFALTSAKKPDRGDELMAVFFLEGLLKVCIEVCMLHLTYLNCETNANHSYDSRKYYLIPSPCLLSPLVKPGNITDSCWRPFLQLLLSINELFGKFFLQVVVLPIFLTAAGNEADLSGLSSSAQERIQGEKDGSHACFNQTMSAGSCLVGQLYTSSRRSWTSFICIDRFDHGSAVTGRPSACHMNRDAVMLKRASGLHRPWRKSIIH